MKKEGIFKNKDKIEIHIEFCADAKNKINSLVINK